MLRLTRKAAALVRVLPTFDLTCEENEARRKWNSPLLGWIAEAELLKLQKCGQFPDEPVRITV
jgi:hypothetical protein